MGRGAIGRLLGAAAAIVAASGAIALAASSNGVASRSPSAIVTAVRNAVDGVSSVHVAGAFVESGESLALNLYLVANRGGRGTVTENGASFSLVVVGKVLYFKASTAFWKRFGNTASANLFAGKWLKTPTTGQYASVSAFTDIHTLFAQLLSPKGKLTKGPTTTLHGQPAVGVTNPADGGILYVATTGKPYPLEVAGNTKNGQLVINGIDQPVTLTPPKTSIDISKLGHQ
ncbi:MAG: hypothetical protein ACRDLP_05510 [Solirubrobacteraceae bacterium]